MQKFEVGDLVIPKQRNSRGENWTPGVVVECQSCSDCGEVAYLIEVPIGSEEFIAAHEHSLKRHTNG